MSVLLYLLFLVINMIAFFNLFNTSYLFFTGFTFFLLFIIIVIGTIITIKKNKYIELSVFLFSYFFYFLAPIIQINTGVFPNKLNVVESELIVVNLIIISFLMFFLIWVIFSKDSVLKKSKIFKVNSSVRKIYFIYSLMYVFLSLLIYRETFIISRVGLQSLFPQSVGLIIGSVSRGILFLNFLFEFDLFINKKKNYFSFFIALGCLILSINPFNTSRYYLAFIIITFYYLFLREKIKIKFLPIFICLGFFVVFPFFNIFRQGFTQIEIANISTLIFDQFTKLHYDNYSAIVADLKYLTQFGSLNGKLFLSSVLFFIPRSIAPFKMIGGGAIIGEFLLNFSSDYKNYFGDFSNVSNPLLGEFLLNFSFYGIFLCVIWIILLKRICYRDELLYGILFGYIIFMMRGDMISSFSNFLGSVFAMFLIPLFLNKFSLNRRPKIEI